MQTFEVVGLDRGYDYVKIVTGKGEHNRSKFPSVTAKSKKSLLNDGTNYNAAEEKLELNKGQMEIIFENVNYAVGAEAIKQDARAGRKDFTDDKFKKPSEIVKMLAGIALFSDEKTICIEHLITGLNIKNYSKYKTDLVKSLEDTFEFELKDGTKFSIEIENITCIPEGVGAYYNEILDIEGNGLQTELSKGRYALVDAGGRSIDSFIAEDVEPIKGTEIGLTLGLSKAFKEVAKELGDDIPYNLIEQEYVKGNNTVYWGRERRIDNTCRRKFNELATSIHNELINKWDNELQRVRNVLLCGGGSKYIIEKLNKLFDKEVKLVDQPQFANAIGYYKLGQRVISNK